MTRPTSQSAVDCFVTCHFIAARRARAPRRGPGDVAWTVPFYMCALVSTSSKRATGLVSTSAKFQRSVVGSVTPSPTLVSAFSIFPAQCAGYDLRPGRRILTNDGAGRHRGARRGGDCSAAAKPADVMAAVAAAIEMNSQFERRWENERQRERFVSADGSARREVCLGGEGRSSSR